MKHILIIYPLLSKIKSYTIYSPYSRHILNILKISCISLRTYKILITV